jgi:ABC-type glycerol-3-phosphate transport system permease component
VRKLEAQIEKEERRAPSRLWYWVAAILFFGSILLPTPLVLWNLFSENDIVTRIIAPEAKTLKLERGKYTVFTDSRAVINGEIIISSGSISGLRVVVRGMSGKDVPVEAVTVSSRYSYGGQTGFAVLEFNVTEAGQYTIEASYREKSANQRALLSIRKEFLGGLLGSIFVAVMTSIIGAFLGVFIFLRTLWRRNPLFNAKRKFQFVKVKTGQGKPQAEPYTPPSAQKPAQKYSPPGSADPKSPVEHQYDRDK